MTIEYSLTENVESKNQTTVSMIVGIQKSRTYINTHTYTLIVFIHFMFKNHHHFYVCIYKHMCMYIQEQRKREIKTGFHMNVLHIRTYMWKVGVIIYIHTHVSQFHSKKKLHTIHTLTHFHIQRIHMKWLPVCVWLGIFGYSAHFSWLDQLFFLFIHISFCISFKIFSCLFHIESSAHAHNIKLTYFMNSLQKFLC